MPPRLRHAILWSVDAAAAAPDPALAGTGSPGSFTRLVPAWLSDLAVRGYAVVSRRTWAAGLSRFAVWAQEREIRQAAQVTRAVMEAYQRHLYRARSGYGCGPRAPGRRASADGDHPLSVRTQRHLLHAIDRFYAWAVKRGHVPANPAADLDLPRLERPLPDYLTATEAEAVLAMCDLSTPDGVRDRAFVELLYATGLRRMEAVQLLVPRVDLERGIVQVVRGKGRKDRYVPLGRRAAVWIVRYVAEVRATWCRDVLEQHLFLTPTGAAMTAGLASRRLNRLLAAAGIQKRGACHLFRHAFATGLVEGGCDVRLIAAMLGHASMNTTMLYTRVGIGQLVTAHRLCHPGETARASAATDAAADSASPRVARGQDAAEAQP